MSSNTISEHFTELEKAGIITGSTIQVNHRAMGINATYSLLLKVDQNMIEQVVADIKKMPFSIPFLAPGTRNNISLIVGLKDISEVSKLKETIRRNKNILDLKIENWIDVKNSPENLEILPFTQHKNKEINMKPSSQTQIADYELDSTDFQIIDKLLKNSRQPFNDLAKEIGTSISTISRKYSKLMENNIIKAVVQINLTKLGYHAIMTFFLTLALQSDSRSVTEAVMQVKNNVHIVKASGEYDLLVNVMIRDIHELLRTQNEIANIPGISRIEELIYPAPTTWPKVGEYISTF